MKKILIVEDEVNMLHGLKDNLEFEGYTIDIANEGRSAQNKIMNKAYDLILLDIMLPNISGFDICKHVRSNGIATPIILLTAKGEEIDKVLGLELGADDYITKPFSVRELLARIKAILRRSTGTIQNSSQTEEVSLGKISVNLKSYEAFADGKAVKMSHKEFQILQYLHENINSTVHRDDIMSNVWGIEYDITTRTVDNFILKLRQKIEIDPNTPKIIHTVHGLGYKMIL